MSSARQCRLIPGAIAVGLLCCLLAPQEPGLTAQSAVEESPHTYFNTLVARSEHLKSFSLRDQRQLESYKASKSRPAAVNYLYPRDPDPRQQDAAKVVVRPFIDAGTLAAPLTTNDVTLHLTSAGGRYTKNRQVRIDDEIMRIGSRTGDSFTVERGWFGTTRAAHPEGSTVQLSVNSLENQVWLPLGTTNGHNYLATWDAWFGAETLRSASGLGTWKTFQFDRTKPNGRPAIWFEVRTRFDQAPTPRDVARVDTRAYSRFGPNVKIGQPLSPAAGTFVIRPETWVRYWALIDQHADDWDMVSLWVADENTDPVQVINRLQLEAGDEIPRFRLEYNTSQDRMQINRGPVVSYVRNFVILRDVKNPESVFKRPVRSLRSGR